MKRSVLLVDDDPHLLRGLSVALRVGGIEEVTTCEDAARVPSLLAVREFDAVVLDLSMPEGSGLNILALLSERQPGLPVVVLTGIDEVAMAVRCIRAGAIDYLVKPVEARRLIRSLELAWEGGSQRRQIIALGRTILAGATRRHADFAGIITQNRRMLDIFRYLEAIAPSPQPVLLVGEPGTGRRELAIALDRICAQGRPTPGGGARPGVPETLLAWLRGGGDSPGPGAVQNDRVEALESFLYIPEIGELAPGKQEGILQLIEAGSFLATERDADPRNRVRIVASTSRDLEAEVAAGRFRRDLLFRFEAHTVRVPPLRERLEDLPLLIDHFAEQFAGPQPPGITDEICGLLQGQPFASGNVGELRSLFEAYAAASPQDLSLPRFLAQRIDRRPAPRPHAQPGIPSWIPDILPTLREAREALIDEALRRASHNQVQAARMLGITSAALNQQLRRRREKAEGAVESLVNNKTDDGSDDEADED